MGASWGHSSTNAVNAMLHQAAPQHMHQCYATPHTPASNLTIPHDKHQHTYDTVCGAFSSAYHSTSLHLQLSCS